MPKPKTENLYFERLNVVTEFIQEHLDKELPLQQLAKVACFSSYHFHRIFKGLVGETVNGYINRLRLEKAAYLLKYSAKIKISEVAVQCGFNSLENFSRQFKNKFGVSATELRRNPNLKKSKIYQNLHENSFYHIYQASRQMPDEEFEAKVEWFDEVRVAYIRAVYGADGSGLVQAYKDLMNWAQTSGYFNNESVRIGMSRDDIEITPSEVFRYDYCVSVPTSATPAGKVGITHIPSGTCVTMHCVGDIYQVAKAWDYLYKDWLPIHEYQPKHYPALEIFRRGPEEIGWDWFDLELRIPIQPLQRP